MPRSAESGGELYPLLEYGTTYATYTSILLIRFVGSLTDNISLISCTRKPPNTKTFAVITTGYDGSASPFIKIRLQAQDVDLLAFLETIAAWVALLGVPSNSLMPPPAHNMTSDGGTDHIFIRGNLARVLLSTWRLQEAKRKGSGDTST